MSRSSDPTKLAVWRERLERFSSSQLAVARFCAREGVSVASFYDWREKLGHKGRRLTDGHARRRTGVADGRGIFQPVAVVPAARGFVGVASGLVPAARAVCIQLPCGTRIEVGADDLDAVRTVVAEVARAYRGREAGVAPC